MDFEKRFTISTPARMKPRPRIAAKSSVCWYQIQATALVEPGLVLIALREAEGDGAGESQRWNLACLVAIEGLHQLESSAAHGVEGLCRRCDLPGREEVDLELSARELGDAGNELFFELLVLLLNFHLSAHHGKLVHYGLKVLCEVKVLAWSK